MKKKTRKTPYTDQPLKLGKRVKDFLPPPSMLVAKEDNVRVTLALSRESIDFFKQAAKDHKVPYQRMIRATLDEYARLHTPNG